MKALVLSTGVCLAATLLFAPQAGAQTTTPGGVSAATPIVWLTPENYNGGTWTNNVPGTVGDFIREVAASPPGTTTGYNYHKAVVFAKSSDNSAPNRLKSVNARNLANDDNVTTIFVFQHNTHSYANHDFFSFNSASSDNGHIVWNNAANSGSRLFGVYWPSNGITFAAGASRETGIMTVDIANASSSNVYFSVDGSGPTASGNHGGKVSYNSRWVLGAGYGDSYGYEGNVQEVIVLKSTDGSRHLSTDDRRKIHSYLSIKYGIALDNANDHYYNSNGASGIVWDKSLNTGYNNYIFGIGRDDASGLNQRQSSAQVYHNMNNYISHVYTPDRYLTVLLGNEIRPYNEDYSNTETLPDMTYLMLGHNGQRESARSAAYTLPDNTQFANLTYTANQSPKVARGSRIYKAQVTGSLPSNIGLEVPGNVMYVMVCPDINFNAANTRVYEPSRETNIAENVQINTGDYISLLFLQEPPAGALLFKEDFGTGSAACVADNYNSYINSTYYTPGCDLSDGGKYSRAKSPSGTNGEFNTDVRDHTNPGSGYCFACNSSEQQVDFFHKTITGLCSGTKLYFSAWMVSLVKNYNTWPDKANLKFELYDGTNTTTAAPIATYATGDLPDASAVWQNFGFEFQPTSSTVTLVIKNNGFGTLGNDFGLDDIEIRNVSTSANALNDGDGNLIVCANTPFNLGAVFNNDGSFGAAPRAQWYYRATPSEFSDDWTSTGGAVAVGSPFNITPGLNNISTPVNAGAVAGNVGHYRLAIASSDANLSNINCRSLSNSVYITLDYNCLRLGDDRVAMLVNGDTTINVAANDTINCTPAYSIISAPKHASTCSINPTTGAIRYKPVTDYIGPDTLTYQVVCTGASVTAKVYIIVQDYPDNVGDEHCFITPPGNEFSFKMLARTPPTNTYDGVSSFGIPVVGDIDADGKVEIIVPRVGRSTVPDWSTTNTPQYLMSNGFHIYNLNGSNLVRKQILGTPWFNIIANPYSIAKVDDTPYASIFVCTGIRRGGNADSQQQTAADRRYLIKYSYNSSSGEYEKSASSSAPYATQANKEVPQPMIADFNGDGIPEVAVYGKIYNARTLALLVDFEIFQAGYGHGHGAHTNNIFRGENSSIMAIADVDGDGVPELIGGNTVYKVTITNPSGIDPDNKVEMWRQCDASTDAYGNTLPADYVRDGATAVADIDLDGFLDVIVTCPSPNNTSDNATLYVWNPRTGKVINTNRIVGLPHGADPYAPSGAGATGSGPSVAFVGDINNDGFPEICITAARKMIAYRFNTSSKILEPAWTGSHVASSDGSIATNDRSGSTTMAVFDFNQDGKQELVYRDETRLRVIDGITGTDMIDPISCLSVTQNEYPVIADVNGDGNAEILITGHESGDWATGMWIYSSDPPGYWAPTRKVWNQFAYNAVNINEDLSVPRVQFNPATVFPSGLRPYNGYMMQQTRLNKDGEELWPVPDVSFARDSLAISLTGDALSVKVGIVNKGSINMEPPIYITLYKDAISSGDTIGFDSIMTPIRPLVDTICKTFYIPDITVSPKYWPFVAISARVNDNAKTTVFPYEFECDYENNKDTIVNPAVNRFMEKHARVETMSQNDGLYANPVSVLGAEQIEYTIKGVNASLVAGTVTIIDTLPAYLDYTGHVTNPSPAEGQTAVAPSRKILTWTLPNISPKGAVEVKFNARPASGVSASQPLFVNYAWVNREASYATIKVMTDSVYHQGAGTSVVTFSAGAGGWIFNASPQAVDYKTAARSGVIVVPDSGYRFAGWSHDGYVSMRGAQIAPQEGVALYDTLTVYGDVELRAVFVPETSLVIENDEKIIVPTEETVWAYDDELHVRTVKSGSIIRIYAVDGVLLRQQVALSAGETAIKLPHGIYVVTINNGAGKKVRIEN